jgi:hypothetical protein
MTVDEVDSQALTLLLFKAPKVCYFNANGTVYIIKTFMNSICHDTCHMPSSTLALISFNILLRIFMFNFFVHLKVKT